MGEIVHYDIISADCIEHVTGVTKHDNKIYISSKSSTKSFAYYEMECTSKLRYDPTYSNIIMGDTRHISSYKSYLVVVPRHEFSVYLTDPAGNDMVNLKVNNKLSGTIENIKDYMLSSNDIIPSKINKESLILTACIIENKDVYFFIQSKVATESIILFVVKGELLDDKLMLTTNFKLLSYYNLYNFGRDALIPKKHRKSIVCTGITLNPESNTFVLLMVYGSEGTRGVLGTLSLLSGLGGLGAYIHPVLSNCDHANLLSFDDKPRGVTYASGNIYYVITNGMHKSKKHFTKYYIVKILNVV